ncbi:hypothetical protein MTR67_020118, partial [Solanum verrucosum]
NAYCDATRAAYTLIRKSVTCFLIKIGDSLVSCKAKKQTTVSKISAEAEYRSLASIVSELVWLLGILKEVGANIELPRVIHSDNKTAIQIAVNPVYHERIKQIINMCYFVREKLQQGLINIQYIFLLRISLQMY